MNKVRQKLINEVVLPEIKNIAGMRLAQVRDIDFFSKKAVIVYSDMQDKEGVEIVNVPIIRQQGMHESGPFIGDTVLIGFFNNDYRRPVILGSLDLEHHLNRTIGRDQHEGKGASVSDVYCVREGEEFDVE